MGVTVVDLTGRVIEDAARALEASQVELQRRDLQNIRLRAALREALDGWDAERDIEGHDKHERSVVLRAFLNGEREGL
jgi:hypothetical protein